VLCPPPLLLLLLLSPPTHPRPTSIKPLFANKPLLIVVNKTDVRPLSSLSPDEAALLDHMEAEARRISSGGEYRSGGQRHCTALRGCSRLCLELSVLLSCQLTPSSALRPVCCLPIPCAAGAAAAEAGAAAPTERYLMTMSTLTEEGVMAVKTTACDRLLNFRVDMKLAGKRIGDVLNRMHVALPKPRDNAARPPVIPPSVAAARAAAAAAAKPKRKTEKDLQEEHGGAGGCWCSGCAAVGLGLLPWSV
jgi:nucleolar GTP-binding protein